MGCPVFSHCRQAGRFDSEELVVVEAAHVELATCPAVDISGSFALVARVVTDFLSFGFDD